MRWHGHALPRYAGRNRVVRQSVRAAVTSERVRQNENCMATRITNQCVTNGTSESMVSGNKATGQ